MLLPERILYVESDHNYSRFHMTDGAIISAYMKLSEVVKLFPSLVRISASFVLNPAYIWKIQPEPGRSYMVQFTVVYPPFQKVKISVSNTSKEWIKTKKALGFS